MLDWVVEAHGVRILHIDSARWREDLLAEEQVDVLCLCAFGLRRPAEAARLVELTGARVVVPCHWDVPTRPIEDPPRLLPGVDLPAMGRAVRAAGARFEVLPFFGELGLAPA